MTVPRNMQNPTLQPVDFGLSEFSCNVLYNVINPLHCMTCTQNFACSLPSLVFMVLPREQCFCCLDCGGGLS